MLRYSTTMTQPLPDFELRRSDGSFRDPAREAEFRRFELGEASSFLRKLLPLLGLLFAAFAVPDYWILGPGPAFLVTAIARGASFSLMIYASSQMTPDKSRLHRERLLVGLTLLGIVSFGVALFAYRNANFHLQAVSVILMIAAIYLIPNRFQVSLLLSLLLAGMGLAYLLLLAPPELLPSERAAYIADFFLMALLSALLGRTFSGTRRREYARTRELEWLSRTDLLTKVGNRRDFEDRLESSLARRRRHGEETALLMLDIDKFKSVNDQHGHRVGDAVLKEIAERLESALRTEDSLARWGGEEFVLLLPRADLNAAKELGGRIRSRISGAPFGCAGTITASIGITMLSETDTVESAVARVDRALYRAKDNGRDRIEWED